MYAHCETTSLCMYIALPIREREFYNSEREFIELTSDDIVEQPVFRIVLRLLKNRA